MSPVGDAMLVSTKVFVKGLITQWSGLEVNVRIF